MQHLDGLDEVQQSHEFEIANLLAATGPAKTCGWNLDRGLTLGTEMQGMCLSCGSMESFQNNCTPVN